MKVYKILPILVATSMLLVGCDTSTSSSSSSQTSDDSLTSFAPSVYDWLNSHIDTAKAGNYSMKDLSDESIDTWSLNANFNTYFKSGYLDLPLYEGGTSLYNYSVSNLDEVVLGENKGDFKVQDLNHFNELPASISNLNAEEIDESTLKIVDSSIIDAFAGISYYTDGVVFSSLTLSVSEEGFDASLQSTDGVVELSFFDFGSTVVEPAETYLKEYVPSESFALPEGVLDSFIGDNVTYESSLTISNTVISKEETTVETEESITTKFAEDKYYTETKEGELTTYKLLLEEDLEDSEDAIVQYITANNEVATDSYGAPFSSYSNMMGDLVELFSSTDKVEYIAKGSAVELFFSVITGYDVEGVQLIATLNSEEALESLEFVGGVDYSDYDLYISVNVIISVMDNGTTVIDDLTPLATQSYHATLEAAFDELKTGNYTASITSSDYEFVSAIIKSDGTTVAAETFMGEEDAEGNYIPVSEGVEGYTNSSATTMTPFKVTTSESETIVQATAADSEGQVMGSYMPTFNFAPELFIQTGENTYKLDASAENVIGDMVPQTSGTASLSLTSSLEVVLSASNQIESISYDYDAFFFAGDETYTYTDIGSTSFDFDISELIPFTMPTSWEEYGIAAADLEAVFGEFYEEIPFMYVEGLEIDSDYSEISTYDSSDIDGDVAAYSQILLDLGYEQVEDESGIYFLSEHLLIQPYNYYDFMFCIYIEAL